ncbi:thiol peroxidase [Desulfotalea psychrophila]|uniref:Thiol peroxidase n=1 Tax=Desulfotalea psychrophila (strain LSv54 / DSM 12343) TaxID=177439 RepID=Q6AM98_DESPS|nr:thiol peroxidase [Desulfotalea psychrophila]CAG36527.1 probable thiol peroxidase [Desulfotalea psychrophila LSv54]
MTQVSLNGTIIETIGDLPEVGDMAADFSLTASDLSTKTLDDYTGNTVVLNIFPSIDTPVCAMSVRKFNSDAAGKKNTKVLCISADLPFAHARFCDGEGLKNVIPLSAFRSPNFGKDYGQTIITGPLTGLLARAVVIISPAGKILYTEQVPEITQEPNYSKALLLLAE